MFRKFLMLEWRAFRRSASFSANLAIKILMGLAALYFAAVFLILGTAAFYMIRDSGYGDPLFFINKFLIYYFLLDLIIRLFLQKIPVMNIRPMLVLPIRKPVIVRFALGKSALSFFNFLHWFFLTPFFIVLLIEGYDPVGAVCWFVGMLSLIYANNFLNILINNKDHLFVVFIAVVAAFAGLQYYNVFDVTVYTAVIFDALYRIPLTLIIAVGILAALIFGTYRFFMSNLHLDTGLAKKSEVAKTEQFEWLDQLGTLGTFLKNDIRLIKRNKRSRMTIFMSILFIFYGLLFFSNAIEVYNNPTMHMFAGIFVTGGFLFTFGQFVPSWDSAYYPLMMTQNIPYRGYLKSKWWLIVIATCISTILSSFYLYFGVNIFLMIIAGAVYNIGVNSHLVLLGGAFTKTPIDLSSGKSAFGDRKAFNMKTMLISLPKLLVPMGLYGIGTAMWNTNAGLALVVIAGIIGFALRDKVFTWIEKIYKKEKYKTIQAYKQNND
ncbi:MAG TPA: DUF5687 family protein [Flavobacterium sp.]|jgi:hypothetical protein